jgi:hypothetical protein
VEHRKCGIILPAQPYINVDVNERKRLRRAEMRTEKGFDKFVRNKFERTQCGPQGEGQEARSTNLPGAN